MTSEQEQQHEQQGRLFGVAASPTTTAVLLGLLAALLAIGLFIPQGVSADALGWSYPPSITQAARSMDFHRLGSAWMLQLTLVLLVLNLSARGLNAAARGPYQGVPRSSRHPIAEATLPGSPANSAAMIALLDKSIPGSRVTALGEHAARADRGLAFEGALVLGVAALTFVVAFAMHESDSTVGDIELVTGSDRQAAASFKASRMVGDTMLPWTPDFTIECGDVEDPTRGELGPRKCILRYQPEAKNPLHGLRVAVLRTNRHESTLTPGQDIEIHVAGAPRPYFLSLVGVERVTALGGFDLNVDTGTKQTRVAATLGEPLDINVDDTLLATLMLPSNARGAPIAVLPGPGVDDAALAGLKLSATPRTRLHFRLKTPSPQPIPLIWVGIWLTILGLLLTSVMPTYRVFFTYDGSQATVSVIGLGLMARPQAKLESVRAQLALERGNS